MILFDVSGSMKGGSFDRERTRAEAGKILFQAMVDKLIGAELAHAVGLLTFGSQLDSTRISRDATRIEGALGEVDTAQGSTRLYDAIDDAATRIAAYRRRHAAELAPGCWSRVFCLTDGEDTGSRAAHWQVTRRLCELGIVLDAFPLAGANQWLQAMAANTGGLCLTVSNTPQGIGLFEREAVLRVDCREVTTHPPPPNSEADLRGLFGSAGARAVSDVQSAVPRQARAPTLCGAYEVALAARAATGSAATQRVFRELREVLLAPPVGVVGAYANADDHHFWKVIMEGPAGTPYEGCRWVLGMEFPATAYPAKPPVVKFLVPIYHVNVSTDGRICLDVLGAAWTPSLSAARVLTAVRALLEHPNGDDPLDTYKATVFRDNRERYTTEARAHATQHAARSVDALKQYFNIS
jgi:ubiquitin-conjugating enzyme E2 D/E